MQVFCVAGPSHTAVCSSAVCARLSQKRCGLATQAVKKQHCDHGILGQRKRPDGTLIILMRSASTAATSSAQNDSKKLYSKTLLLPKTDFPMRADAANREKLYRKRTTEDLYRWQWNQRDRPLYVLQDGPPFANGHLHIGHALNKILKDLVVRYKILRGHRVCYIPGWDCHGLPIEQKALQSLRQDASVLGPTHIRKAARELAEDAIETQKSEFQQFAITSDWNHVYRTFNRDYEVRQLRVFQKMVEKGLIYRASKPVLWSPSSRTALAEAEIDYRDDHVSTSAFVKFPVTRPSKSLRELLDRVDVKKDSPVHLSIWTTTPWTLPANMFVACGADIEYALVQSAKHGFLLVATERLTKLREVVQDELEVTAKLIGNELAGTTYQAPFHRKQDLPVIVADYVTADSGTGLVHSAAGHGMEDYLAYKAALGPSTPGTRDIISPVDDSGTFSEDTTGHIEATALESLRGLKVIGEGSSKVLHMLDSRQLLLGIAKIRHKYPYDWRTKQPVIIRTTPQWFADVGAIKAQALTYLDHVMFTPPQGINRLKAYVHDRAEWCISRQRAWGVPIPVLYDLDTDEAILDSKTMDHIISVLGREGTDYWWSGPVEDFVPMTLRNSGRNYRKGTDTIDVWFDSGTSWSGTQEFLRSEGYSELDPMADVCIEGTDQHRGWFQSSLLTAAASEGKSPYRNVITHGFVLDRSGVKMSKSLGNVVSPLTVVNGGENKAKQPAYGADVLRLWAATSVYTTDVHLSNNIIETAAEALRKIRNTMRFMLGNASTHLVRSQDVRLSPIDRIALHDLFLLESEAREAYEMFAFHKAMSLATTFCTNTLSSFYFETIKSILYSDPLSSERREAVVYTLQKILDVLISIIAPALPHLAEEVHQYRSANSPEQSLSVDSVFRQGWKQAKPEWYNIKLAADFDKLRLLRKEALTALEGARQAKRLGTSTDADLVLTTNDSSDQLWECVNRYHFILSEFFVVSNVHIGASQADGTHGGSGLPGNSQACLARTSYKTSTSSITISILAADSALKCPRCWLHIRRLDDALCSRCQTAIA